MKPKHSDFILFKTEDEKISVDVRFEDETVWLTQDQMAILFERDRTVIVKHIANIFSEGELDKKSNVQFLHIANSDKPIKIYNLNVIISVGYRVKSQRGTQFRIWATKRLNEFIRKGLYSNLPLKLFWHHRVLFGFKSDICTLKSFVVWAV